MFIIKEGTPADKVGEGTTEDTVKSMNSFLEKQGYVVRSKDQDSSFLQTHTQQEINKVIGERNAQFEATILETTGIGKTQGEKFHEYHKRALSEKLKEVNELQTKLKGLEEKGVSGSELAQQYKRDLEAARSQITSLNTEWEKKLQDKEGEVFSTKVNTDIEKIIAEVKAVIDPTIKPDLVEDIISARISKFYAENKAANLDGITVWKDSNGVTQTNKKDGKPQNTKERLLPYFENIMNKQRQQGGSGSGDSGQGGEGQTQPKWKETTLPPEIKSRVQLGEYLIKSLKLDASTKDYTDAFESLKGNLPLR